VTRLVKYLRDIKTTFTCPSFLLTTLLGDQVRNGDSFSDTPSALQALIGRLDDVLEAHEKTPKVVNPKLRTEVLSEVWDDTKYTNFRANVHQYREWIDDAFNATERGDTIAKWRRVFGDEFADSVVLEEAAQIIETARELLRLSAANLHNAAGDLVAMVKALGRAALPPDRRPVPRSSHSRSPVDRRGSLVRRLCRGGQPSPSRRRGAVAPLSIQRWFEVCPRRRRNQQRFSDPYLQDRAARAVEYGATIWMRDARQSG
jgi:hypothetical protein